MKSFWKFIPVKIASITILLASTMSCCLPGNPENPPTEVPTEITAEPSEETVEPTSDLTPIHGVDVVFMNGEVLTMDSSLGVVKAVAIENGKILAVGSNEEIENLIGTRTQVIDLQGLTLMPGFIDSHNHFFNWVRNDQLDLEAAQLELLSKGITTSTEAYVDSDLFDWILALYDEGQLHVRVALYLAYINACGDILGHWYKGYPSAHIMEDNFRVPGIKLYSDGGACNQPAVSFEYMGGGSGKLYFDVSDLTQVILEAQQQGYQVAIHALGDRGIELSLDAIEKALKGQPNDYRHRIEHNTLIRDDLLPRYGEVEPVPVIFGKFPTCFFNGVTSQFRYLTPPEFRYWEWRYGDLIRTNPDLPYAWHSDFPVFSSFDPFEHLYGYVTRKEIGAEGQLCEPADWAADDVIPVEMALYIMTTNSAYATFYDDITGRIKPGLYADMIILSENPLAIDPEDLLNISVKMTMIGGRVEYCAVGEEPFCPVNPGSP